MFSQIGKLADVVYSVWAKYRLPITGKSRVLVLTSLFLGTQAMTRLYWGMILILKTNEFLKIYVCHLAKEDFKNLFCTERRS